LLSGCFHLPLLLFLFLGFFQIFGVFFGLQLGHQFFLPFLDFPGPFFLLSRLLEHFLLLFLIKLRLWLSLLF
jgi:hypothetical protein